MKPIKTTQITDIWGYLETVDWTESWLCGLVGFHLLALLITILTWKRPTLQAIHFISLLIFVYFAEYINEAAAKHWHLFAKQQYFDSRGMFISLVWSAPLLVNCLIILGNWIVSSSQLMVTNGRLKLAHERRLKEKDKKQN